MCTTIFQETSNESNFKFVISFLYIIYDMITVLTETENYFNNLKIAGKQFYIELHTHTAMGLT